MAQVRPRHKRRTAAEKVLKKYARENGLPVPSSETVNALFECHDENDAWSSQVGTDSATKEICGDYLEMGSAAVFGESPDKDTATITSRTALGFSHYIVWVVRPYAEAFRELAWKSPGFPFATPRDAVAWVKAQHRQEEQESLGDKTHELKGVFKGVIPDIHTWAVREGGTLDKLRRLCERVNYRYPQWTREQALGFVLWEEYPLLSPRWSSQKSEGSGDALSH